MIVGPPRGSRAERDHEHRCKTAAPAAQQPVAADGPLRGPPLNRGVSSMISTRIRVATSLDREDIRGVHLRAFPEGENQLVATLAANLVNEETDPETIALVAEIHGSVVGHIAFSPVMADTDKNWLGYILAPLGVKPEYHKVGIGSKLIESGIELLLQKMANVLFVYGDPKYYGRFGFSAEATTQFTPPYELKYPFGWQARVLHEGGSNDQAVKLSCVLSLRDPALW
jgi:putative acetyltransferase